MQLIALPRGGRSLLDQHLIRFMAVAFLCGCRVGDGLSGAISLRVFRCVYFSAVAMSTSGASNTPLFRKPGRTVVFSS